MIRYNKLRITLDTTADFECLFMQHGIEKEGLAFPSDSLNFIMVYCRTESRTTSALSMT